MVIADVKLDKSPAGMVPVSRLEETAKETSDVGSEAGSDPESPEVVISSDANDGWLLKKTVQLRENEADPRKLFNTLISVACLPHSSKEWGPDAAGKAT